MRRKTVRVHIPGCGETTISFLEENRGKPVLVLHGFTSHSRAWERVLRRLKKRGFRGIVPDLPGFGRSPPLSSPETIGSLVKTLKAFLDSLGIKKVYLVGHSLGGTLALAFAIEHPEYVRNKVVAVGPIVNGREDFPLCDRVEAAWYRVLESSCPLLFQLVGKPVFALRASRRLFHLGDALKLTPEAILAGLEGFLHFSARAGVELVWDIMQIDLREGLRKLDARVLWVDGEDVTYFPAISLRYAHLPPKREVWSIPQSGHITPVIYTEEGADRICEFFGGSRGRQQSR